MRIELAGVSKSYGGARALDRVRLELEPGRIVAVVGLNGAGKTTLLLALAGLISPSEGDVYFDGERFSLDRVDLRQRFHFLPDFPACFAHFSPLQHIAMMVRLYEKEAAAPPERVLELLTAFDLLGVAEAALGTLSRGQLYKAALVSLLTVDPELWLLDEPLASGMDPLGLRELKQRARAAAAAGRTIIYTTQILSVAQEFSDEIILLHRGEVRAHGPLAEVLARRGEAGRGGFRGALRRAAGGTMTLYDRAWLRDVQRAVRGAVAAVPHLRREARKRRNFAPMRTAWAGGRPVITLILAGTALSAPHATALHMVMLWSFAMLLLRAGDLQIGQASRNEAGVLAPMPVTDAWVFSFHSASIVRTSLWLLTDFSAVYAVLGWKMQLSAAGFALLAGTAILQWLAALGAAALLLRLFPRAPFGGAGMMTLDFLAFSFFARGTAAAQAVFAAAAATLGPLIPAGWLHRALAPALAGEWSPRLWFAAPALALVAALPWQRRALAARYRFRALAAAWDSANGSEDEALADGQSADAPRAPTLADTRAFLEDADWVRRLAPAHPGPIESVVLRWLTTRERVVLDFLLGWPADWTGEWRRAWIGTAVATIAALVAHRFRPEALPVVFGLGGWIAAGMAAPLGGGAWSGLSSAVVGQRACAMCALLPLGHGRGGARPFEGERHSLSRSPPAFRPLRRARRRALRGGPGARCDRGIQDAAPPGRGAARDPHFQILPAHERHLRRLLGERRAAGLRSGDRPAHHRPRHRALLLAGARFRGSSADRPPVMDRVALVSRRGGERCLRPHGPPVRLIRAGRPPEAKPFR